VWAEPGLSFGNVAEVYELGRPGWPNALLDSVPVPPGSNVLDLAAGTGKLARLLSTRHRVVCVEPDDEMRALIRDVEAVRGSAEAIPLADDTFDAVFVGEAFHWFDGRRALGEIARVLRPRGALVICFNEWEDIVPPLPAEARRLVRSLDERFGAPGGPRVRSGEWKGGFAGAGFEELRHEQIPHSEPLDRSRVVALFASQSNVARQPADVREAFADELRSLVPEEARSLELRCDLHWTRRAA
jgi:SAM-dependent methyltransferase